MQKRTLGSLEAVWHISRYQAVSVEERPTGPIRMTARPGVTELLKQLIQVGIALTSERELSTLLERIVAEARRFTNAEAGTLFLRSEDELRFAVTQNDVLAERMGDKEMRRYFAGQPLCLTEPSLAGYVTLTGQSISLPDAYEVSATKPYVFNRTIDARLQYQTGSVLVVRCRSRAVRSSACSSSSTRDAAGVVVPFDKELEGLVQALASQAAVAIRNTRLEELSFKDPLTGVFNRRYFSVRLDEESKRHTRFAEPLSLVLIDLDRFKWINDELGHRAGDDTLKEAARVISANSRSFSIVTRYGGDEFAILLVNTPKAGAVKYAQRIKDVIERHPFPHGPLTVSVGVAAMPEDLHART
jgi:diguanylate cyclase (GGDEF)-like protein